MPFSRNMKITAAILLLAVLAVGASSRKIHAPNVDVTGDLEGRSAPLRKRGAEDDDATDYYPDQIAIDRREGEGPVTTVSSQDSEIKARTVKGRRGAKDGVTKVAPELIELKARTVKNRQLTTVKSDVQEQGTQQDMAKKESLFFTIATTILNGVITYSILSPIILGFFTTIVKLLMMIVASIQKKA